MVRLGKKVDNLKDFCCPTFAQITSGEASSSHSIIWLPPTLFSLFVSKNVWNRYNFNYVDKVDTSFQFIGRSFSNEGLKLACIQATLCNGSLFFPYNYPQLVSRNIFDLSFSERFLKIELFPIFRKFLCFYMFWFGTQFLNIHYFRTTITRTV